MSTATNPTSFYGTMSIKKTNKNQFDIEAFLASDAGKEFIEKGFKSKVISHKEYLKRTAKLRKKLVFLPL